MTTSSGYLGFDNEEDTIRTLCFFFGLITLTVTLCYFILIILHLHCFPKFPFPLDLHSEIGPGNVQTYSTLSASSATICTFIAFSVFPICTKFDRWYSEMAVIYSIAIWDTYIMAKLFMYLMFFGHLFNPFYQPIYQSAKWFEYFLRILLTLLVIFMFTLTIGLGMVLFEDYFLSDSFSNISAAVYFIADSVLSISTTVMLLRPICNRQIRDNVAPDFDISILKKYATVSVLQLISAVSYQMTMLALIFVWIDVPDSTRTAYNNICNLIRMIDCSLLIICIYLGFARHPMVCNLSEGFSICLYFDVLLQIKSNRAMCKLFCIWCCCGCCRTDKIKQFAVIFDGKLGREENLRDKMIEDSALDDLHGKGTVQVSSTPDVRYLEKGRDRHCANNVARPL